MSNAQPRQYHAQLVDLKETLISSDAQTKIEDSILAPYREHKQQRKEKGYQPPVAQPKKFDQGDYIDFYKLNDDLFTNNQDNSILKENDPYRFFKQAAN